MLKTDKLFDANDEKGKKKEKILKNRVGGILEETIV